ncbi:MAG: histidinol-phosphate transaminase [Synergistales bacterium]|nr:histidinol-phosphate transaminase [Synergistales bacterium]
MSLKGIRKAVLQVDPYVPGKTTEEVMCEKGLKNVIKLGSNENPYGPFLNALKAMTEELSRINSYPDVSFKEIKRAIAELSGLEPENVCISHGAEGMLQTIGKTFLEPGDEVILPSSTYGLYREISKLMGAKVVEVPMKEEYYIDLHGCLRSLSERTKLIWLNNPNNPTGTVFDRKDLQELLRRMPSHSWVILDEAYGEFTDPSDLPDTGSFIRDGKNVISVRTFSKAFGLAGARIGYCLCSDEMSVLIDTVSEPFNANRIGIAGAMATLKDDSKEYLHALSCIRKERERLLKEFAGLGLMPVRSHTNFVFVETGFNGDMISERMLDKGVIVRSCTGWNYPSSLRITVGTPRENEIMLLALSETLEDLRKEVSD